MRRFELAVNKYFPFIIICFLISDIFTNFVLKIFNTNVYRFSGFFKLFIEIIMVLIIIFTPKKINKKIIFLGVIFLAFSIGQLYSNNNFHFRKAFFTGNLYFFNKYIFIIIFSIFIDTVKIEDKVFAKVYLYFEKLMYVNSIAIVVGFLFSIELFRSYAYSKRFGYSGFFSKPEEVSYLYMVVIIANYFLWKKFKNKVKGYKVLFFILIALFLGQKKIFLFLGLLSLVYVFSLSKYRKRVIMGLFTSIVLIVSLGGYYIEKLIDLLPYWKNHIEKSGILSAATSYRNVLLDKALLYVNNNWNTINYFFGGISLNNYKTEFGFIDVFLFFGFFGMFYYMYIFKLFTKKIISYNSALVFTIFITSFFSGGLLLNVTAIMLFYIMTYTIIMKKIKID